MLAIVTCGGSSFLRRKNMAIWISSYRYRGWRIESLPSPKHGAKNGFALPPDYDPDSDNGARIIQGNTLAEMRRTINDMERLTQSVKEERASAPPATGYS